ncbi:GDSL esterase/lipase [Rhynchospora pubera]|uniref:GDSL esterase/lipase n=1 Tax=Rhynchospora pubera TaxID=906938 RepID=A0AAV8GUC2_9POAL|nr:GDSL esterase/lipase [Rhynchospora pubera]
MAYFWHLTLFLTVLLNTPHVSVSVGCYTRIFSFGDSLTDTGNYLRIFGNVSRSTAARLPYGESYFHHPTGRWSDGRLLLDFIAEDIGLPFVPPYLGGNSTGYFRHGANFAVGGATALNHSIFHEMGVPVETRAGFLAIQVQWFKELLTVLCLESDCREVMDNAFFFVGEMGINDYNTFNAAAVPFAEIKDYVPGVINAIASAVRDLIELGAKTIAVAGVIPLGCTPSYLTILQTEKVEEYNLTTGCLNWINEFSQYHDQLLFDELDRIGDTYPDVTIIYADYYGPYMNMIQSPRQHGLKETIVSCCGGGGPYNFALSPSCGAEGSSLCKELPSQYVSWDGLHLTDAAHKIIAQLVHSKLSCKLNHKCYEIYQGGQPSKDIYS